MIHRYAQLDWKLIGAVLALSVIGIILIMSAQHYATSTYEQNYYLRQSLWFVLALIAFAVVIHLPMRLFDAGTYLLYGISLVLLVAVLAFGSAKLSDARRFFSLGPINLAPSDIAKVALLLTLSRFFAYTKLPPNSKRRLALSAILTLIPAALILKQPDLGTSLVFFVMLFVLWFWSGLSIGYLFIICSPLLSLVAASHWIAWALYIMVLLVILFAVRPGLLLGTITVIMNIAFGAIMPLLWNRLADYQKLRILVFLDPGRDPRGAGYQIIQSKIAIGSGGLFGKGFLSGSQTRLDFTPERHTDFIFSVLGEEFGLWGCLIVLLLFSYVFYRAIKVAARCRSRFASNVVMGAAGIIMFQFLVNVGMTLGLMPVTGLALPFVSYGGTALVLGWTLIGFIVAAEYHWQEY
ncbi:MAG: rod shape-determining protein RodA [candidate division Zixibacteria bacterium]|nr:rod shape-determining protein RodA [candidate division Zixibacteria bacterium]